MRWRLPSVFIVLPCGIYAEFFQRIIRDVSLAFFTAVSLSGRLLVCSFIVGQSQTVGSYIATFEVVSRGYG